MTPSFTVTNGSNGSSRDPIFLGDHSIRKFIGTFSGKFCRADFYYFFFRQNSFSMFFSEWMSFLRNFILMVLCISSYKKMVRINARTVVTFMKNMKSLWNKFISNNPRKSMSGHQFSTYNNLSIRSSMKRSFPFPTSFFYNNAFPESISKFFRVVLHDFVVIVLHWEDSFLSAVCTSWSPMMTIIQRNSWKKEKIYGCK